jgi:mannose-6-phosphate isomerase-like protein (cupin superfamily)
MSRFRRSLSRRRPSLWGGVVASLTVAAVTAVSASATPPAGVAGSILSRGTVTQDVVIGNPVRKTVTRTVRFRVRGRTVTKRVGVSVKSVRTLIACSAAKPCDTAFQQVTINPGGYTGWHTHPGRTFVAVAEGEGTLYHGGLAGTGCAGQKYGVGAGFFQPSSDVHNLRNEGAVPLVVHAFYVLPAARRARRFLSISRSRRTVPRSRKETTAVVRPRRALPRARRGPMG